MSNIVIISGSPAVSSRSSAISKLVKDVLVTNGNKVEEIAVRNLPAEDLLYANFNSSAIQQAKSLVEQADGVIVISPVYKASYPGILKAFLDLVPEKGLTNKFVFPIATAGSAAHLLALEYAFKPVFSVLGARDFIDGVYIVDSQVAYTEHELTFVDAEVEQRLEAAIAQLQVRLQQKEARVSQ